MLKTMGAKFICGVEAERMQWGLSELPRHLKNNIFAKLPMHSAVVSRLVCKEWNSILSSRSLVSSLSKSNPWLLLCSKDYCMAYCFSTNKWMKLSLSFLPTPVAKNFSVYRYSSAELGLLLLKNPDFRFCVCNPLTKGYLQIGSDVKGAVIGIVQGENRDEPYLITRLGSVYDSQYFSIRVYSFFQDSWKMKFELGVREDFEIYPFTMVACNGVLFFGAQEPITIVGYNIRGSSVLPVRIDTLPRHILENDNVYKTSMGAYGLSVLLVVMMKGSSKGMIILQFFQDDEDPLFWRWREFATSVPRCYEISADDNFVVVGDYLCFIRRNGKFLGGIAYNLKEEFWQFLTPCTDIKFFGIMSFHPKPLAKTWQSSLCSNFN